jgi:ribose-phosphate pyrophosphokinase
MSVPPGNLLLFGGTASSTLAGEVARALNAELGACSVTRFPDGETSIRLLQPVRDRDVCLIQSTAPPVNDHLVELLAFTDACRRAGAGRITAVVPYFGYSRSDRDHGHREPITASMVATLLESVGVARVVTVDLHTPQIAGFFRMPVEALSALPVLCEVIAPRLPPDAAVVAPDAGRVPLATLYAARLQRPLVVLHKRRESGTLTRVTHVVGEVEGRTCLLVDDIISTGGTLVESVAALSAAGATGFLAVATHGLLLGDAVDRMRRAGIGEVVITDTVAHPAPPPGVRVASVAALLADAVRGPVRSWS